MFRRLDSGLPKDPIYPTTLEGLGYFINDKDEIRSVENPKAYFKFFLTKNERYNIRQRDAMNEAIRNIISDRLTSLGLTKTRLPLNAAETSPNLPIFISSDIKAKKRVIILFYEHKDDLGVFAHRIIGGPGGINAGSAVNMVKYIQSLSDAPGIILANMGQLMWWRRGRKAVTQSSWLALPQKSAVEFPFRFDEVKNTIPGNRNMAEHVDYIFNHVVQEFCDPQAKLDVIGVAEGAMRVAEFLEKDGKWKKWGGRMEAFAALATYYHADDYKNEEFASWFQKRGRAYLVSQEPCGVLIAGLEGRKYIPPHGCPVFSLGDPYYIETLLPNGYKTVIDWFQEVAEDSSYANPIFATLEESDEEDTIDTPGIDLNQVEEIA